ncbi:DUF4123 domain-containing protein [Pseudomonas syringae]|nr:DUF4123 domain-containing protein [Pseudomonas syringae]MCF5067278.1 DUF4123 domain-containing protein [Pseudomonas syringae]
MSPLQQWLHEQPRLGRNLYLMLDTDGQQSECTALSKELGAEYVRNLYLGTTADSLAHAGPHLFQIGSVAHPVLQNLFASPARHWGWLASASASDTNLDALAAHWRARLIIGERPAQAIYRFHDSRVLGRALAWLRTEQHADYLGPITSVCYWQGGQWTVTDNPNPGAHPLPPDPPWLKTPTPDLVHANIQFDNTRRYLVGQHTQAMLALATHVNMDDWLWEQIELARAWGWQQPEQVHFLLTQSLHLPGYRLPDSWQPRPGEEPAAQFQRVYQWALHGVGSQSV